MFAELALSHEPVRVLILFHGYGPSYLDFRDLETYGTYSAGQINGYYSYNY